MDGEPTAVSRLRWLDLPDSPAVELPHVRGRPIDRAASDTVARIREWPNRVGVCEPSKPGDTVLWYPDLADPPEDGVGMIHVVARDLRGAPCEPTSIPARAARTSWLRDLVGAAAQRRGFSAAHPVVAPCAIVLTPGAALETADTGPGSWGPALAAVPRRLVEFPGGVQLAVTASVWARRDAYADAVGHMLDRQRTPDGGE